MAFGDFAIAPSTTITLCAGVPLSKGSEDTFLFSSPGEQASKIASYHIATFSECTYQRNMRNVIRVGLNAMGGSGASCALKANYCIFNNTAFEGKNIYAFVDQVDYVNNNTIDIHFTIDAMQTFMFDYELRECYVEREHSETDQIGDNLVPEDFSYSDTVVHSRDEQFLFKDGAGGFAKYTCVIYYIENTGYDVDGQGHPRINSDGQLMYNLNNYDTNGDVINHVYVAASTKRILVDDATINNQINDIMRDGGTIIGISMVPGVITRAGAQGWVDTGDLTINTDFRDGDTTFVPKNAKMFTYPFNYIVATNNAGTEEVYRWERFGTPGTARFNICGGYQPSPECALVPEQYEGLQRNYGRMVLLNTFPTCAWSEDSFLQWKLRNGNSFDASCSNSLLGTLTGMISSSLAGAAVGGMEGSVLGPHGSAIGAGIGAVSGLFSGVQKSKSLGGQYKDAISTPDKLAGNSAASVVNEVIDCTGFTLYRMNLCYEQAKAIDDYFTMYGYATKRLKVPDRSSRPKYNYVQTRGCTIYGDVPAEFAVEIQERYNNGVRFWRPSATIGIYSGNEVV